MYSLYINTNLYLQTIFLFNCLIFCNWENLCLHPSLCGSVPMHWCILDHMAWPWWCRDMADGRGVIGLFLLCLSLISLPFLFFSLSSFESSLRGSHGLVEIMVWCGRSGWCHGGGLVGGDCVVDGRSRWCCGWLSVMSQMPRPRSNYI